MKKKRILPGKPQDRDKNNFFPFVEIKPLKVRKREMIKLIVPSRLDKRDLIPYTTLRCEGLSPVFCRKNLQKTSEI